MNAKQRVVITYGKADGDIKKLINKHYPNGFKPYLFAIPKSGNCTHAFTLDSGDILYLIKVEDRYLKSADELIDEVEDYWPSEDEFNP